MTDLIKTLINPQVLLMHAYHVQPADGMIKLDAMENPYGFPAELRDAWMEVLAGAELNRYPSPEPERLLSLLRETQNIPAEAGLILGNGSDELIQIICMSVAAPGRKIMSVVPSFVMFEQTAKITGMEYVGVPLHSDFTLDLPAMLEAIEQQEPEVIFLAYPNNPTANLFERQHLLDIIAVAPGLVVIDEAYAPFAADTMMDEVLQHENLLLMRTLSKYGLAGCRLGYLCGPQLWLSEFNKVRMPYNINVLSQLTAEFALQHNQVFLQQADNIKRARESLIKQIRAISKYEVYPSDANFILFKTAAGEANKVFEALKTDNVLIKNLSGQGGLMQDTLRVTVGAPAENEQFMASLKTAIN